MPFFNLRLKVALETRAGDLDWQFLVARLQHEERRQQESSSGASRSRTAKKAEGGAAMAAETRECYECGARGHLQRDCPRRAAPLPDRALRQRKPRQVGVEMTEETGRGKGLAESAADNARKEPPRKTALRAARKVSSCFLCECRETKIPPCPSVPRVTSSGSSANARFSSIQVHLRIFP